MESAVPEALHRQSPSEAGTAGWLEMKLSREYSNEAQARAREAELKALGYRAWCNRKADGAWEVFWWLSG
jgi:hypothetical protein